MSKQIDVLVVEDFEGLGNVFDGFKDGVEKKLLEKGYNVDLTICKSYGEFKKLKIPLSYDAYVTDIILPGGREDVYNIINEVHSDPKKWEKTVSLHEKYVEHECLCSGGKGSADYINWLNLFCGNECREYNARKRYIDGLNSRGDFASGLLIAKWLKEHGKKPTIYTSSISSKCHSDRSRSLLKFLGEDVLHFEDILSVAKQEFSGKYRGNDKLYIPESGDVTLISGNGENDNFSLKEGGVKRFLYPEAIEAAIKYQTK